MRTLYAKKTLILVALVAVLVFSEVLASAEEVYWQGKLETDFMVGFADVGSETLMNRLSLELVLPWSEDISTKVAGDLQHISSNVDRDGNIGPSYSLTAAELTRMYIRLYRPGYDLTLGLQPLSWGAGMFFNPADPFAGSTDPMTSSLGAAPGYSGVSLNVPLGVLSRFTAFHFVDDGKSGIKYRTNLNGTDLIGAATVRPGGENLQVLLQAQGDLGIGWFAQTAFTDLETSDPGFRWAAGADYSWNGKVIVKGELSNAGPSFSGLALGPGLGTGDEDTVSVGVSLQYIPDEFSSLALTVLVTPEDKNFMLMPVYTTQLTDLMDLRAYGGFGKAGAELNIGLAGAGLSYSF
ncbi:MAG: hypothetical protein H0Z38_04375 [Firmicutes bacterium]|nr:hypothetical protein [Bacillota bacterium]